MRGISKKMFISILTSVIVMVTMVATTFAWVGIFTYANTDNFNLNLKVQDLDVNYYLTISASGKKGTFSDEADIREIQKQVLKNQNRWKDELIDNFSEKELSAFYSKYANTIPSSYILNDDNTMNFYAINYKNTSYYSTSSSNLDYLKFDLYLSVDAKEGIQEETEINSNVFLSNIAETIKGTLCSQKLTNLNSYKNMPSIPNEYSLLKELPDTSYFNINSANALRFALCLYEPININDDYVGDETPSTISIYHGGKKKPDVAGEIYDLGGNLPEDYNTALQELLIIRPNYKNSIFESYNQIYNDDLNRAISNGNNELELIEENSKIWSKPSNIDVNKYLGVHNGIQTKMKISTYVWFEGWDSDCLIGINEKPITLNLTFTAGIED